MKKGINSIAIILVFCMLVVSLVSCSDKQDEIVGQWYNDDNKCLDIRSDSTWKLEGSYGSGTYKLLEDKETFEFTDFYGDTQETKISEDELGKYIDFGHYGDFYKDAYPSEQEVEEVKTKNAISLSPFEGIKYEISGISPYCKISINNQGCSDEVQKYVSYTLDKDNYANGETAIITAELSTSTGENSYKLSSDSSEYKISGRPEYVSVGNDIDYSDIEKEALDLINSSIATAVGTGEICGLDVYYDKVIDPGDAKKKEVEFIVEVLHL